jgi:tyrosine-protein kinase
VSPDQDHIPELELRDYLRVLRRRKGVIATCTLVVLGVALAFSLLQTPVYAGKAEILLQPRTTDSLFDPETGQTAVDRERAVRNELRVIESKPVRDLVRQRIGIAPDVSPAPRSQTDVVEVRADSTDARRAAEVANAYANAYIEFRRKQAVDDLLKGAEQIQTKVRDLQRQIDPLPPGPEKDALISQQSLFRQRLDQLQVDAALMTGGVEMVTPAAVPASPFKPKPLRAGLMAAGLGLFFGAIVAFVVEYLDDSVKDKDEVERLVPGLSVIGLIPAVVEWTAEDEPKVISIDEPRSPAAEAYRTVRTSIQFLALESRIRTLEVTSAGPREGKTTTIANLGVALARAGQRVVVVCGDLRRPRLHEFFGLDNSTGLTSVLLGVALQPAPNQARLSVLASGPLPPDPSELLSSHRTVEVLTSLQTEADIVLIDAPPVLPVTDALVLSGRVDATLVVCLAGATTRKDVTRTMELLNQVDAPVVGAVLNGVTGRAGYGHYDGYYHYDTDPRWGAAKGELGESRAPVTKP